MEFTNPTALWGLAGLAIPVAIHLLSLKESQVIRFGSLRHLKETKSRQFRGIRLNELLLLFLRTLLILWLVFFISGLHNNTTFVQKSKWVVIEKGLENDSDFMPILDSLQRDNFELRYLAENFPILSTATPALPVDYWRLIEALKELALHDVVIISNNRLVSFRGEKISLPDNMRWLTKSATPHEFIVSAIQTSNDSVWVRKGKTDAKETIFETHYQSQGTIHATHPDTLSVLIASTGAFARDAKTMEAALRTIDAALPHTLNIKSIHTDQFPAQDHYDWLIWLSGEAIPASLKGNLIFSQHKASNHLLTPVKDKQWILTYPLNEESAVNENLTLELATMLFPDRPEWKVAVAHDRRVLPDEWLQFYAAATPETKPITGQNPVWEIIWLGLIFVTLLIERIVAYKRNQ